ncbi:tetracycline resistance transcriptional repressor TetR [Ensifer adhaerens]|uniref:tetracycline resistance transcriptional repressor TetR n=1 Tax=Ensifer adhaerens TaxID=106592 RepID=UPI0023A9AB46|nr:tetracycline resistance transcriptional repressor TetR [Ensifer adhaerens]WDZ75234.1 tetracycline resistance transcriptional repressor TetR [Ensifer adhaerens]
MTKLQRDAVVRTALTLLNEVGLDGLTTRRLAERLGVQQPALYWHFKNKQALIAALAEAMMAENHDRSVPQPDEDWREFLTANARSFRKSLLAYRDGARIHAGTRPSASQMTAVEAQIRLLHAGGFAPADAASALLVISHYVVGAVLEQQTALEAAEGKADAETATVETAPLLAAAMEELDRSGPDATFEFGLSTIIEGLAPRRES